MYEVTETRFENLKIIDVRMNGAQRELLPTRHKTC
jgi:hypothetical protein